jgi:hypothetical protein
MRLNGGADRPLAGTEVIAFGTFDVNPSILVIIDSQECVSAAAWTNCHLLICHVLLPDVSARAIEVSASSAQSISAVNCTLAVQRFRASNLIIFSPLVTDVTLDVLLLVPYFFFRYLFGFAFRRTMIDTHCGPFRPYLKAICLISNLPSK